MLNEIPIIGIEGLATTVDNEELRQKLIKVNEYQNKLKRENGILPSNRFVDISIKSLFR